MSQTIHLDNGEIALDEPLPDLPADKFEYRFRKQVASLVDDILVRCYVTERAATVKRAHRRQMTVERLAAEEIALKVMKKVDEEYD